MEQFVFELTRTWNDSKTHQFHSWTLFICFDFLVELWYGFETGTFQNSKSRDSTQRTDHKSVKLAKRNKTQ